jgi:glyoxylase I family protein
MALPSHPPKNPSSPFASLVGPHAAVWVPDYEAGKNWYVDKLDLRVLHEWPFGDLQLGYLALPNDNGFHIELLGYGQPDMPAVCTAIPDSPQGGDYHHVCMRVDNVGAALAELERRGVTVIGEPLDLEAIGSRLAFFADPWGNIIELLEDRRRSIAGAVRSGAWRAAPGRRCSPPHDPPRPGPVRQVRKG